MRRILWIGKRPSGNFAPGVNENRHPAFSHERPLAEGFLFYESQQENLGDYFWDSLFSDIDSLNIYGGIHRRVHGYYRLLSKRFPYGIYYEIEQNEIRVRAVLDCRRDPKWIRQKLK